MKRRKRPSRHRIRPGRVGAAHGPGWATQDWFVPFENDSAVIYHGHDSPDDHSECGPKVFCCEKAASLLTMRYPTSTSHKTQWEYTDASQLTNWLGIDGPSIFYFFFCDPDDPNVVRFAGVREPYIRDTLLKRRSLDLSLDVADRIYVDE